MSKYKVVQCVHTHEPKTHTHTHTIRPVHYIHSCCIQCAYWSIDWNWHFNCFTHNVDIIIIESMKWQLHSWPVMVTTTMVSHFPLNRNIICSLFNLLFFFGIRFNLFGLQIDFIFFLLIICYKNTTNKNHSFSEYNYFYLILLYFSFNMILSINLWHLSTTFWHVLIFFVCLFAVMP